MIELIGVSKIYRVGGCEIKALDNVGISFREKEFVCVHGPSGCGKTTLLNIVGGLDRSTSGKIIIKGQNTSGFKDVDWDAYATSRSALFFKTTIFCLI